MLPSRWHRIRATTRRAGAYGLLFLLATAAIFQGVSAEVPDDPWYAFEQPAFDQLNLAHGLPNEMVTTLAQDAGSFLWVGTWNGLARYDGQRFHVFRPDNRVEGTLPDGYIRAILPLVDGRVLVGMNNAGLAVFDPGSGRFTRIPLGAEQVPDTKIFAVRAARDGGAWVTSELGLDHFDPVSGVATAVPLAGFPPGHSPRIFDALEDPEGNLWLGANPGLFYRPAGQAAFARIEDPDHLADDLVWRLRLDEQGRLWAGGGSRGVLVVDPDGRRWAPPLLTGSNGLQRAHTIRAFARTAGGELWIATDGGGVIVCHDADCREARSIRAESGNIHALSGDMVRDLLLDESGTLWFATSRGLSHYRPTSGPLLTVSGSRQLAPALIDGMVTGIMIDQQERIWLILGDAGVEILDLDEGSATHLELPVAQVITSLLQTRDGTVWIGGSGVARIDPQTLRPLGTIPELAGRRVTSLMEDNGDILISTYNGIHRYTPAIGVVRPAEENGNGLAELQQIRWLLSAGGYRWYAGLNGLGVHPENGPGLTVLHHDDADPHSLPHDFVSVLAHDSARNRLWVGTEGGIAWIDLAKASRGSWQFHRLEDERTRQRITAMQIDASGSLWASGDHRLIRIDGNSLEVLALARRDGLRLTFFNDRATATWRDGSILMGGGPGLTIIRPDRLDTRTAEPGPIRISGLELNGAWRPLRLDGANEFAFQSDERAAVFDFALLDFRAPEETRYSYRLEGFDESWHMIPGDTPATAAFTNLPTGSYVLRLRADIHGLGARTVEHAYPVMVAPKFHETPLARILQALSVLLVAGGLVYIGLRWSHHQKQILDRLVRDRTEELHQANAKLEALANVDTLTGLHTRRHFMDVAAAALVEAHARRQPLALLVLDLDHFKEVNDRHGHLAGDTMLNAVARVILGVTRESDLSGRYGGEEITICLPNSDRDAALRLAERLRSEIEALRVQFGASILSVTCSIGVASLAAEDATLLQLIDRADRALYCAKRKGRNEIEVANGLADDP